MARRKVHDRPRFIQIATAGNTLCALDEKGDAWMYETVDRQNGEPVWVRLERGREENFFDHSPQFFAQPMAGMPVPGMGVSGLAPLAAPNYPPQALAQVVHNQPVPTAAQPVPAPQGSARPICRREGCGKIVTRPGTAYCEYCIQELVAAQKEKDDEAAKVAKTTTTPNGSAQQ
jgi:hypothetical protein